MSNLKPCVLAALALQLLRAIPYSCTTLYNYLTQISTYTELFRTPSLQSKLLMPDYFLI